VFYTPTDNESRHPNHELEVAVAEGRYEEEGWRVRKDGSRFLANVVITALTDPSGQLYGFAKVTRDITKRKRAEEQRIQTMRDQISRSYLRDILYSVTEGRLRFCENEEQLPPRLPARIEQHPLGRNGLAGLRKSIAEIAASIEFPELRARDLITAASEAGMNAVVHGHAAAYSVGGTPRTLQVWITDQGSGIEIMKLHRATLERGFSTEGTLGHGFWLMLHTSDRLWLHSTSSGTTIVLEQDFTTPEPDWLHRRGGEPDEIA